MATENEEIGGKIVVWRPWARAQELFNGRVVGERRCLQRIWMRSFVPVRCAHGVFTSYLPNTYDSWLDFGRTGHDRSRRSDVILKRVFGVALVHIVDISEGTALITPDLPYMSESTLSALALNILVACLN